MTRRQRLILQAAILGSGVVTIDGSIIDVALPAIERDGWRQAILQWRIRLLRREWAGRNV